jgi:hypothetical protein
LNVSLCAKEVLDSHKLVVITASITAEIHSEF